MFRSTKTVLVTAALLAATLPALGQSRIEREFDLAPGGELVLDADQGSVEVQGSGSSGARVVISSRSLDIEDKFDVSMSLSGGRLSIRVDRKGSGKWFNWGRGGGLKFEIQVPRDTRVDIDTSGGSIVAEDLDQPARLDTSGGSIVARQIRGSLLADTSGGSIVAEEIDGDVTADTSGGSISIEQVRGDVVADTSGGSITISEVTGKSTADTSGGSITLDEIGGYVYADTSGGSIEINFSANNYAGGEASTSGGGIRVNIDPTANLDLDAVASGGSVIANVPITVRGKVSKSSLKGKIGGGGALLKLRTSGGKIRIEPR